MNATVYTATVTCSYCGASESRSAEFPTDLELRSWFPEGWRGVTFDGRNAKGWLALCVRCGEDLDDWVGRWFDLAPEPRAST